MIQRHNEVRDALGDLANLVCNRVHREPIVREADYSTGETADYSTGETAAVSIGETAG